LHGSDAATPAPVLAPLKGRECPVCDNAQFARRGRSLDASRREPRPLLPVTRHRFEERR